jgi:hypothetical protein
MTKFIQVRFTEDELQALLKHLSDRPNPDNPNDYEINLDFAQQRIATELNYVQQLAIALKEKHNP